MLRKYDGLKPVLVGVPYPVVYEIPGKATKSALLPSLLNSIKQHPYYPNYDYKNDVRNRPDYMANGRTPKNQPPPKYPNYNLLPHQPDFAYDARNTRRDYEMYELTEVEKQMVHNYRQQQGRSDLTYVQT
jgi:hypothetical protein